MNRPAKQTPTRKRYRCNRKFGFPLTREYELDRESLEESRDEALLEEVERESPSVEELLWGKDLDQ